MEGKEGTEFLHRKYPELHRSEEVKKAAARTEIRRLGKPREPHERINAYLRRLEEIFEEPKEEERQTIKGLPLKEFRIEMVKDMLHQAFIVKPEDISESYFTNQQRIARELGHGDIPITDIVKREMTRIVINDQKQNLDVWVDYLGSKETMYPTWFKYYVMRNIVKLGPYDKEKKEFRSRSKGTTALFPDINEEALAYVFDGLNKSHTDEFGSDDPKWQALLNRSNFAALYAYTIEGATPAPQEQKEIVTGEWIKFPKGSDPTPLYTSLQGRGTGWCTAGEAMAKSQLQGSDFYVFYSTDSQGKNTLPRIAIRMGGSSIAEVRGIAKEQNLEPVMIDIAEEKMKSLPGAEQYKKRVTDMKHLTALEKKINDNGNLNPEELRFLYEIGYSIDGFGSRKDPRIQELREKRNQKQDLSQIFNCQPEEIALNQVELNDNTVVLMGDLNGDIGCGYVLSTRLRQITGNADFAGVLSLGALQSIGGNAKFTFDQMPDLGMLERIDGSADFGLSGIKDLGPLKYIGGSLSGIDMIQSLGSLQSIGGRADFISSKLPNLGALKSIGGFANFRFAHITSLGSLEIIGGDADFSYSDLQDLGSLQSIGGKADFSHSRLKDLGNLQSIGGDATFKGSLIKDISTVHIAGSSDFEDPSIDIESSKIISSQPALKIDSNEKGNRITSLLGKIRRFIKK